MKKVKVDIIGSCVTRDAFEFVNESNCEIEYKINNYISKTSIISLMSQPSKKVFEYNDKNLSNWQKKQIKYDILKQWYEVLEKSDSDIIIIDFIDERYDILQSGDFYLTNSNLFKKIKYKGINLTILEKNNSIYIEKWHMNLELFLNKINKLNKKIILHKVYWKDYYINNKISKSIGLNFYFKNILYSIFYSKLQIANNQKYLFNKRIRNQIKSNNLLLEEYYNIIEKYNNIITIEVSDEYHANRGHKWGLAPFHFENSYYLKFIDLLSSTL